MADDIPQNRLDAALELLEKAVQARVSIPMRELRELIAARRSEGAFDEMPLTYEIEHITARDLLESRRYFSVGEEIGYLTVRLRQRGFP